MAGRVMKVVRSRPFHPGDGAAVMFLVEGQELFFDQDDITALGDDLAETDSVTTFDELNEQEEAAAAAQEQEASMAQEFKTVRMLESYDDEQPESTTAYRAGNSYSLKADFADQLIDEGKAEELDAPTAASAGEGEQ